jgi:hypothetical protein
MREGYGIYFYDLSQNKILDSSNNELRSSELFPNIETKTLTQLVNMFTDISYCDNLDDISYSNYNNNYILNDDMALYSKYEGFSQIPMTFIERIYLFMVGLLFICILSRIRD